MKSLKVKILPVGGLSIKTSKINHTQIGDMSVAATRRGGLKLSILFVCKVGEKEYIRVTPLEPLWIDVNIDGEYTIRSNTNWILQ